MQDVSRFRVSERARLMELGAKYPHPRRVDNRGFDSNARNRCRATRDMRVAAYWPIRGEPDLRGWMTAAHSAGATVLLPVIVENDAPLIFRVWPPDCVIEHGICNIPVPTDGKETQSGVVISPLLGADETCFQPGIGGGYYDRTLARPDPLPKVISVGFPDCVMPTIFPMPWDVPMDIAFLAGGSVRHR